MRRHVVSLYRSRLAKERGYVQKDWGGRLRVALVYPNRYRVGMSNLGFQWVYYLFNQREDVVAERAFLPDGHEMSLYHQWGGPLLSLESQRPLNEFHLIAFSLSFENDYPNILTLLKLAKIPLLAQDREDAFPLVAAGGVITFMNPEPLSPFFDFFVVGEAEPQLDILVDTLYESLSQISSKQELLRTLVGRIPSIYVPAFYRESYSDRGMLEDFSPINSDIPEKVTVAKSSMEILDPPHSCILSPETEFSDMMLVELGKGCGRGCRFCAAGYVYRPPRFQVEERLLDFFTRKQNQRIRWGLISSALSDVPYLDRLGQFILEHGCSFSVSSLRADAVTKGLLKRIKAAGQRTITMAPEAGSERLRRVINKHLSQDQIIHAVEQIAEEGDLHLRLYFIIGLPTETREDVEGIVDLAKVIKHHMVKIGAPKGRVGHIRLSVNCFVPKPFTPFQWLPMDPVESLKEKQRWLQKMIAKEGGIRITYDVPKWAYVQTLLSVGDRRVAKILLLVHENNRDWNKALRHSELNPDFFVYRHKERDERFAWDFLDHGIDKKYLINEYDKALASRPSPVCRPESCTLCGVCGGRKS
ncbi:MAG: radical SAM protein [Deltaproteobacteria bacterium]|nr:radical SAM protein [Deltaproteobacteria bacterium]MBW1929810.1 radical SAM protein [Deltaproteobacteria bacterium]MBW2024456.1 radical SAM protein [Deltaproteobacteria bacterium]